MIKEEDEEILVLVGIYHTSTIVGGKYKRKIFESDIDT